MTSEKTPRTDAEQYHPFDNMGGDHTDWVVDADFARQLERELTALKRGEFICQKCSLRKDGEHDTPIEF